MSDDPWTKSNAPNEQGIVTYCRSHHAASERYFREAVEAFRADGNRAGEASALCNLSRVLVYTGHTGAAIEMVQQGMAIYDELGLTFRLANARYALGIAFSNAGRQSDALEQFTEALHVFVESRQRLWEGTTHFRMAQALLAARRAAQAAQHAEQALATGCIGGDWMRANVLTILGRSLQSLGQLDRAQACWREALVIHERAAAPEAAELRGLLAPAAAA